MRSIWKGYIRFSLVTIPIRIYSAVDSAETIRFQQLHAEDHGAVGYDKKCKTCGKALSANEIVKGYEFEPDKYVIVSPDDLAKIRLESTKIIEIQGFIRAAEIHPGLYDSPYLVGPDGPVGAKTYHLLSTAMQTSGRVGIGKVVLSAREEAVVLAPQDSGIMLYKLRQPNELRKLDAVPQLAPMQASKDELKLSISLVESMATTMDDVDLTDRYRDALRELIEAKIAGREVVAVEPEVRPVTDILAALQQSLAAAQGKRKPMERSKGPKRAAAAPQPAAKPARSKKPKVA
jgi:DNA end-binding protein Ku